MTKEEYNQCVDIYSDSVYRFIVKNIRDKEKSRDIIQDTYEKLWLNIKNVNFNTARSYIFSAAYHTMIDLIRRDKKQTGMSDVDFKKYSHTGQYSDLQEILHDALSKLPTDQRSVVLLRDYEGYAYSDISEITGLSESQVKVYIFRARSFLKNYIGSMETVA